MRFAHHLAAAVIACCWPAACESGGAGATPGDGGSEATGAQGDAGDERDGSAEGEAQPDATMGSETGDDGSSAPDASEEPVYLESGAQDAMIPVCTAPLPDAGFSTLADLPIAQLCAQSGGDLVEYGRACQGSILVIIPTNPGRWWLFSAATGQLEASGSGDDGSVSCAGGVTGFTLPYQCWFNHGWAQETFICPDAAPAESGVDAADGD